ncbi:MAG: DUF1543 domain-containing protein [Patescibacteria group bacterium]
MKLYMIQIGFRLEGMNTEGHDTVFSIASSKEEAFKLIKAARPYAQHIDTCLEVNEVDGYEVCVTHSPAPMPTELKLWFMNLGAYREGQFGEVHKCILLTAPDLPSAKAKAKQDPFFTEPGRVLDPIAAPHIDDKHALDEGIDDVLCVSETMKGIELKPSATPKENVLTIAYIPLK